MLVRGLFVLPFRCMNTYTFLPILWIRPVNWWAISIALCFFPSFLYEYGILPFLFMNTACIFVSDNEGLCMSQWFACSITLSNSSYLWNGLFTLAGKKSFKPGKGQRSSHRKKEVENIIEKKERKEKKSNHGWKENNLAVKYHNRGVLDI